MRFAKNRLFLHWLFPGCSTPVHCRLPRDPPRVILSFPCLARSQQLRAETEDAARPAGAAFVSQLSGSCSAAPPPSPAPLPVLGVTAGLLIPRLPGRCRTSPAAVGHHAARERPQAKLQLPGAGGNTALR